MGIENHAVRVIQIQELVKHPNADSLSLVHIGGYQVVVKTADWKGGDLAAYIQPDSVVPAEPQYAFLWDDMTFENNEVPLKRRRVTARRFRKEWSEGLLTPITKSAFDPSKTEGYIKGKTVTIGDDVAELMGVTHYEPPEDSENTKGENESAPGSRQNKRWPRSVKGWLILLARVFTFGLYDYNGDTGGANTQAPKNVRPVYDVEAYKNYTNTFIPGEEVIVTEKIHGSNARYTFDDGKLYAGSRNLWKSDKSNCIWRRHIKAIENSWLVKWLEENPGVTVYGEVVPTQGTYKYGCENGQTKLFLFDIRTSEGEWMPVEDVKKQYLGCGPVDDIMLFGEWAPVLYEGPFDLAKILPLVDGPSTVRGAGHIREGIVIRAKEERVVRGLGRAQLKIVSNAFLEKDSK